MGFSVQLMTRFEIEEKWRYVKGTFDDCRPDEADDVAEEVNMYAGYINGWDDSTLECISCGEAEAQKGDCESL